MPEPRSTRKRKTVNYAETSGPTSEPTGKHKAIDVDDSDEDFSAPKVKKSTQDSSSQEGKKKPRQRSQRDSRADVVLSSTRREDAELQRALALSRETAPPEAAAVMEEEQDISRPLATEEQQSTSPQGAKTIDAKITEKPSLNAEVIIQQDSKTLSAALNQEILAIVSSKSSHGGSGDESEEIEAASEKADHEEVKGKGKRKTPVKTKPRKDDTSKGKQNEKENVSEDDSLDDSMFEDDDDSENSGSENDVDSDESAFDPQDFQSSKTPSKATAKKKSVAVSQTIKSTKPAASRTTTKKSAKTPVPSTKTPLATSNRLKTPSSVQKGHVPCSLKTSTSVSSLLNSKSTPIRPAYTPRKESGGVSSLSMLKSPAPYRVGLSRRHKPAAPLHSYLNENKNR